MKHIEKKPQSHNLRPFLVWRSILFMVGTGAMELIIATLLNIYVFPLMIRFFWKDLSMERQLSNGAMLALLGMIFLELLVLAVGSFLPVNSQQFTRSAADNIERWTYNMVPELGQAATVSRMSFGEEILLFAMILLILVVLAVPIALGAGWYAGIVSREVKSIEQAKKDQFADAEKQRNLMLSDIAHDLRTPITTISGYAKALHDGMVKEEDKKQEYLEAIMSKSARMEELINLLFEYSKLNSAGFSLHLEEGDLAELVRENVALIYDNVEAAGMELDIIIPEYYCKAKFDRVQLSRVITNLINNAIKHNVKGTKICVSLRYDNYDEKYVVVIADNGDPIPPEVAEHLFEPFAVGDASRSTKGGSGLGLSISAKIVEMHGGTLSLREKLMDYTKGFVFEIYPEDH